MFLGPGVLAGVVLVASIVSSAVSSILHIVREGHLGGSFGDRRFAYLADRRLGPSPENRREGHRENADHDRPRLRYRRGPRPGTVAGGATSSSSARASGGKTLAQTGEGGPGSPVVEVFRILVAPSTRQRWRCRSVRACSRLRPIFVCKCELASSLLMRVVDTAVEFVMPPHNPKCTGT